MQGAAKAGQLTAERPDGKIFDFTGGAGIIDGKVVDPTPSQAHALNSEIMAEEVSETISPEAVEATGTKRTSAKNSPKSSPPAEPPKAVFGRPANIKHKGKRR